MTDRTLRPTRRPQEKSITGCCRIWSTILDEVSDVLTCDCPRLLKDGSHLIDCPTNDVSDVVSRVHDAIEALILEAIEAARVVITEPGKS